MKHFKKKKLKASALAAKQKIVLAKAREKAAVVRAEQQAVQAKVYRAQELTTDYRPPVITITIPYEGSQDIPDHSTPGTCSHCKEKTKTWSTTFGDGKTRSLCKECSRSIFGRLQDPKEMQALRDMRPQPMERSEISEQLHTYLLGCNLPPTFKTWLMSA